MDVIGSQSQRYNFGTLDTDVWELLGDATKVGGRIRLTDAANSQNGVLRYKQQFNPREWLIKFDISIENGTADPADEVNVCFLANKPDGTSSIPSNGYYVHYDHFNDQIELRFVDNGSEEVLASQDIDIRDDDFAHSCKVLYETGYVEIYLDGERVIAYTIENPVRDRNNLWFSARTGGENAEHYIDNVKITQPSGLNFSKTITSWDNEGIAFYRGSNTYKLMNALVGVLDRLSMNTEQVLSSHHIRTAHGRELDNLGQTVNVRRLEGESDDKYRLRIQTEFRLNSIEGTFDEVAEFIIVLLNSSADNVIFDQRFDADPAVLYVSAQADIYDNTPLTRQEIIDLAGRVVSAGHEIKLEESGTFILKADGDPNDPNKGLTSDVISTGGTLAADI